MNPETEDKATTPVETSNTSGTPLEKKPTWTRFIISNGKVKRSLLLTPPSETPSERLAKAVKKECFYLTKMIANGLIKARIERLATLTAALPPVLPGNEKENVNPNENRATPQSHNSNRFFATPAVSAAETQKKRKAITYTAKEGKLSLGKRLRGA